jgi:transcriptional regulator with XRE-family HTH domain
MEFHEKLQELRKKKGLTQEELAAKLYVSRTAISKWESGRGCPNIDSLKAISKFFSVTLDALLSGEELLALAEEEHKEKTSTTRDLVFGLLDCGMALLFFLPLFGQTVGDRIEETALFDLTGVQPWLKTVYLIFVAGTVLWGILTLALQNFRRPCWTKLKTTGSLLWSVGNVGLFLLSRQPYVSGFAFLFLIIKGFLLLKHR